MSQGNYSPHQSSLFGMNANTLAVFTYLIPVILVFIPIIRHFAWILAWLLPILIFFMEKNSNLVKFHALQSVLLHVIRAILLEICAWLPLIGGISRAAVIVICFAVAIMAIIGAYNYKETHVPYIGDFVDRLIK